MGDTRSRHLFLSFFLSYFSFFSFIFSFCSLQVRFHSFMAFAVETGRKEKAKQEPCHRPLSLPLAFFLFLSCLAAAVQDLGWSRLLARPRFCGGGRRTRHFLSRTLCSNGVPAERADGPVRARGGAGVLSGVWAARAAGSARGGGVCAHGPLPGGCAPARTWLQPRHVGGGGAVRRRAGGRRAVLASAPARPLCARCAALALRRRCRVPVRCHWLALADVFFSFFHFFFHSFIAARCSARAMVAARRRAR